MKSLVLICVLTSAAAADPAIAVAPKSVHPGDAVLVTVTGVDEAPKAKAGGQPLAFFPARGGFQAVFAVPLTIDEDHVMIEVAGQRKPVEVPVLAKKFGETKLVVEEEYANPTREDGKIIDADNAAITASYAKAPDDLQLAHPFRRPPGAVTGTFGEWRTFQDGHRAQHVGLDIAAKEGSPVASVNDGEVVLVRDTFLAGRVVVIAHGAGIESMYFHLQKATVAEGDHVRRGERIGLAGHTGRTTGPHLHVGIHVRGGLVDPAEFFKLAIAPRAGGVARVP